MKEHHIKCSMRAINITIKRMATSPMAAIRDIEETGGFWFPAPNGGKTFYPWHAIESITAWSELVVEKEKA